MEDGCILFNKNFSTVVVKGKGTGNLEFTSGKVLSLTDVLGRIICIKGYVQTESY